MGTTRLEAFSDGVLAIIITIMVLELKVPVGHSDLAALKPVVPILLCYLLSFIYVGIYWNNHHHLMTAAPFITGGIMWANLHLLFWLSLIPFVTEWMGENHYAPMPTCMYGVVLLMCALAFLVLEKLVLARAGKKSLLVRALRHDIKERASPIFYAAAIGLSFVSVIAADVLYVAVAMMWLVPDRRIETVVEKEEAAKVKSAER